MQRITTPFGHDDANVPTSNQLCRKRGHMRCGGCCDVRRAVIIITSLAICIVRFQSTLLSFIVFELSVLNVDDGILKKAIECVSVTWPVTYLWMGVFLACYSMGLWGAIKYNATLVTVSFLAFILDALLDLIAQKYTGAIVSLCLACPHWFLIKEIKRYHHETGQEQSK